MRIRMVKIFICFVIAASLAVSLSLRQSSDSGGGFDSQLAVYVLPATVAAFILIMFALRCAMARAAMRMEAEREAPAAAIAVSAGGGGGGGGGYVPQATPVGWAPPPPPPPLQYQPQSNQQLPGSVPYVTGYVSSAPADGSSQCSVCLEAARTTALGCGHVFCDPCAYQLSTCALCRAPVTTRIRLY